MVLGKDRLKWAIFAGLALSTAITGREIIWLFLLGGAVAYFAKAARMRAPQPQVTALLALRRRNRRARQGPRAALVFY